MLVLFLDPGVRRAVRLCHARGIFSCAVRVDPHCDPTHPEM